MDDSDRKDLKIQALLEKISRITTTYESSEADLRVEVTVVRLERDEALNLVQNLRAELERISEPTEVPVEDETGVEDATEEEDS